MNDDVTPIHRLLAGLRSRIRRAWLLRGVGLLAAAAGLIVLLSFVLDYALDLPLAVRAVHLALAAIFLFGFAAWSLIRPLRTPLDDDALAQTIEHGLPDLADRLISALDFAPRLSDATELESREMMAGVVAQAREEATRVDTSVLVDGRPARNALLAGAGAVAVVALSAILLPGPFGLWFQRGVLLADVDWPRRTTILVEDFPTDSPRVVTRGDELRIVAVAEGVAPDELTLHYEEYVAGEEDGDQRVALRDTRKMYPLEGEAGRYAFDFRSVAASFRFWITGGDDDDEKPLYQVRAMVPPRIARIAATVQYPDYTGLPDETLRETTLEVLEGSTVSFELVANMPLESARLVPHDAAAQDLELSGERDTLHFRLEMDKTHLFHLELTAQTGQRNRLEDDDFQVYLAEDDQPVARILFPDGRIYRTPDGIVPFKARVTDDFGVGNVEIVMQLNSDPGGSVVVWPPRLGPEDPPIEDRRSAHVYLPLDLATYRAGDGAAPVKPGDLLYLELTAVDSGGNESTSQQVPVEVLEPEALIRRFSQTQAALREQLGQLRRNQGRALVALRSLRARIGSQAPDAGALDSVRDLQVDQGRITNDLEQFEGGIERTFNAYVLNRIGGGDSTIERLLEMFDEALSQPTEESHQVFPRELYASVVQAYREERIYDPDVVGTLMHILSLTDECVTDLSPRTYDALRAWSEDAAHASTHLDTAEAIGVELEAKLMAIDQRMDRWEQLQELIAIAQNIRELEEGIAEPPGSTDEDDE